jgi:hypothetical protein
VNVDQSRYQGEERAWQLEVEQYEQQRRDMESVLLTVTLTGTHLPPATDDRCSTHPNGYLMSNSLTPWSWALLERSLVVWAFLGSRVWPERKADNREPIVTMWDPQHLTTLYVSKPSYLDKFFFTSSLQIFPCLMNFFYLFIAFYNLLKILKESN